MEQQRSLQGSNRTWSRDFGGAGAELIPWSGDQAKHLSYCGRGGQGQVGTSWRTAPDALAPLCHTSSPPSTDKPVFPADPHLDPSKMPMYGDDFYGPGLSAIYLSPRRYFPCTHIPSLLFSTISPPSVFHHFSPPPVFPV